MPSKSGTAVQELEVGPFSGGINTYSDPAKIADDEMADCVNFDIQLDGSLKSRPPWSLMESISNTSSSSDADPPDSYQLIIGTGTFEGYRFIIVNSNHTGNSNAYIYYVDGPNAGILALITPGSHSKAHRYDNDIFLVPDIGNTGLGAKYDLTTGIVTVVASMPVGYASAVYKDRLWISGRRNVANNSRLFFSELANFAAAWPGVNFFDINPGDGDAANDLVVYQDNLVIFKDNATYVLTYDTSPAQAVLQVINGDIGAMGPRCVDVYENSVFVLKYNQVYEMSNYDFVRVSVKLPFEYDPTFPVDNTYEMGGQWWKYPLWLRIVGDRAIVRFYNRLYVYHLRLRAWTRWDSNDVNIQYLGPITRLDNTNTDLLRGFDTYVAGSTLAKTPDFGGPGVTTNWNRYFKIFMLEDIYEEENVEDGDITPSPVDISLSMLTKQYDVGISHRFKRLMHWGINCYTARDVTGTMFPFSTAYKTTWLQLHLYHWHDLNTWEYPLVNIPGTTQTTTNTGKQIKFIRFPKSLRFRLLQFQIEMLTVGNTTDGPASLYTITSFVAGKQLVPKAVN